MAVPFKKISNYLWEIPRDERRGMNVPARVYATEQMLREISRDRSLSQLINVATLPGLVGYVVAMPDIHEGYGMPIGGVFASSLENGVISPGSVGYDINCGVRLLQSDLSFEEAKPHLEKLAHAIFRQVPSGVGRGGRLTLDGKDFDQILEGGAARLVQMGYGDRHDLAQIESGGVLSEADASLVSLRAKERGRGQLGTMGAGNHFVEVEAVEQIFDDEEARKLQLFSGQVCVLIHTGSRGLGHQIATDYIHTFLTALPKYGISLVDRELACAPFNSPDGKNYFRAMSCGANFAWANREFITQEVREAWQEIFGADKRLAVVYDVAHNIAKIERYAIGDTEREVIVHRKGATRAFPDQPVLIPGSMGTGSYVLLGTAASLAESFGSTCHGAGRRMSRTHAKRVIRGSELKDRLQKEGIAVAAGSLSGLAEEAPEAYKDVDEVVSVVHHAGIARKVARLRPIAVVKG